MKTPTQNEIDRNHARISKLRDRTADLFAMNGGEELTLCGQTMTEGETFAQRCQRATPRSDASEPEQSTFF